MLTERLCKPVWRAVKHLPAFLCLLPLLCPPTLRSVPCQAPGSPLLHFSPLRQSMYALVPRPSQLPPFSADPAVSPLAFFLSLNEGFPPSNLAAHLHKTDSPCTALSLPNYWPGTAQPARFCEILYSATASGQGGDVSGIGSACILYSWVTRALTRL